MRGELASSLPHCYLGYQRGEKVGAAFSSAGTIYALSAFASGSIERSIRPASASFKVLAAGSSVQRSDFENGGVSLHVGVTKVFAQKVTALSGMCVFVVVWDTPCHRDTVLLYSQGHAVIIAASDSIIIQFCLLRRGQEVQWDIRNG